MSVFNHFNGFKLYLMATAVAVTAGGWGMLLTYCAHRPSLQPLQYALSAIRRRIFISFLVEFLLGPSRQHTTNNAMSSVCSCVGKLHGARTCYDVIRRPIHSEK